MKNEWFRRCVRMTSIDGIDEDCLIEYCLGRPVEMIATSRAFGRLVVVEGDLFEALCKVRLECEKHRFLLLCNGARKDTYPSRMSRQMGRGEKIYVLINGIQARKEDMIDLLEAASSGQVTTVAEQRENFDLWLTSLGSISSAS